MFTIYCTRRLLKRIGEDPSPQLVDSTTALGNWYAHLLYISRVQLLIFVNEPSRLAVITPAKNTRMLGNLLTNELFIVLSFLGIPTNWSKLEIAEMIYPQISKTASRSVLGTISDYKYQIKAWANQTGVINITEIEKNLSTCPIGPIFDFPESIVWRLMKDKYQ